MPKRKPVSLDEIENMVAAATEMQGALVALIETARSAGVNSNDCDPMTLREGAQQLVCCARECSDAAVVILAEARELERRKQLAKVLEMRARKDT